MIDHILDFSRGLAGVNKIVPSPVNFDPFLRGIERNARLLAAKQGNRFELRRGAAGQNTQGLVLLLDADPLRRVLDNLISNAARYTHNGVITLTFEFSAVDVDRLRLDFAVMDTGEGIDSVDLQRIFMPFERVRHGTSQDGKGAGLGLAIARQLTELMGGNLTVESKPGQGSCFRFWVLVRRLPPQAHAPMETPEGFEAAGYLGRRQSLLVVDDNEANRTVLVSLLEELGFQVTEAESGQKAAEQLKRLAALDLVITDQFMDDGDGWRVLEAVNEEWPGVPVLLVSAAPPNRPLNFPEHLRFSGHFLRPLEHEPLLRRMGDLLELTWSATPSGADFHSRSGGNPSADELLADTSEVADDYESIAYPSEKELRIMTQLVETGQITAIKEWATGLKLREPRYIGFADRVITATQRLNMEGLRMLAERGQAKNDV